VRSTGRGPGGSSRRRAATASGNSPTLSTTHFARWDRSHLQEFTLAGQIRLCRPDPDWEIEGEITEDYQRVKLTRLQPGEQFVYVFDLGDDWAHLCTVGAQRIDPVEALGIVPDQPLPYWGWGDIPDQYRRRWDGDDGESAQPADPGLADLPPLRPGWGPPADGRGAAPAES
jgi:Plasmid pRiA4b ORF-3-like protein